MRDRRVFRRETSSRREAETHFLRFGGVVFAVLVVALPVAFSFLGRP